MDRFQRGMSPMTPKSFERREVNGVSRMLPVPQTRAKRLKGTPVDRTNRAKRSTPSALPGTQGVIQIVGPTGSVLGFISNTLSSDGGFTSAPLLSNALAVTIPSTCPAPSFNIRSALGDVGASVNPQFPLSSGTSTSTTTITSQPILTTTTVSDAMTALSQAQFALASANGLDALYLARYNILVTVYTAAKARDDAYYAIVAAATKAALALGTLIVQVPNETAVQQTATDAFLAASSIAQTAYIAAASIAAPIAYHSGYDPCVALKAAQTTALTAAGAAADIANGRPSVAAAAAALAVSTAAIAAMDMDPICEPLYGGIATALYAPDIAALIGIVNFTTTSAASSVQTATTNLATAQTNLVLAQAAEAAAASGSNYASLVPSADGIAASNEGAIWSLDCTTNALTATYTNTDGSIITPTTVFIDSNGMDIDLTGNYVGSKALTPSIGQIVTLIYVPTN